MEKIVDIPGPWDFEGWDPLDKRWVYHCTEERICMVQDLYLWYSLGFNFRAEHNERYYYTFYRLVRKQDATPSD